MIILALRGNNFMKFRRLELEDIPRHGLIGITGANEGGKSTIAEAIQFALFGKTLSTLDGSVLDLITWDEDHCTLELDFEVPGKKTRRYRIWREMDRFGTNFARVVDLDNRSELASGLMHVQERLKNLLRFDFEDYWRSFYLAQGDPPRSPEEMAEFLDRIVGTDVLIRVRENAQGETAELENDFAQIQANIHRNKMQIDKYVPNVAKIPSLHETREKHAESAHRLKDQQGELDQQLTELDRIAKSHEKLRNMIRDVPKRGAAECSVHQHLETYPTQPQGHFKKCAKEVERVRRGLSDLDDLMATFEKLQSTQAEERDAIRGYVDGKGKGTYHDDDKTAQADQRRALGRASRARWFGSFFLLIAFVAGFLLWAQYDGLLDLPTATGQTLQTIQLGLGVSGGVALLLSILLYVRGGKQSGLAEGAADRIEELLQEKQTQELELERLEALDFKKIILDEVDSSLTATKREAIQKALAKFNGAADTVKGDAQNLAGSLASLADSQHGVVQKLRAEAKEIRKEKQKNAEALKKESSKRDRTDSEIREYQKQDGRREGLEEQNASLREKASGLRDQLDTRMLLIQMLDETVDSIRHRAGPNLGRSMRRLLPSLTGGRYTDMQVTHDFHLRLFTSEKSDFLQSHELSGGTYEGLSIGFRLVFSQAFIKAVTRSEQFLFLDEPFKAMDRNRIHQTLKALTKLSTDLVQVFLLEPEIPDDDRVLFDEILETRVGSQELIHRFQDQKPGSREHKRGRDQKPSVDKPIAEKSSSEGPPRSRREAIPQVVERDTDESQTQPEPPTPGEREFGAGIFESPSDPLDEDIIVDLPDEPAGGERTPDSGVRGAKRPPQVDTKDETDSSSSWLLGSGDGSDEASADE